MALGHTKQKYKKTPKQNDKVNQVVVPSTTTDVLATEGVDLHPAGQSGQQDDEDIGNTAPINANVASPSSSQTVADVAALDIAQKEQPKSKSARKRAAIKKKKQQKHLSEDVDSQGASSSDVAPAQSSTTNESSNTELPPVADIAARTFEKPTMKGEVAKQKKKKHSKAKSYTKTERPDAMKLHDVQSEIDSRPSPSSSTSAIVTNEPQHANTAQSKSNKRKKKASKSEAVSDLRKQDMTPAQTALQTGAQQKIAADVDETDNLQTSAKPTQSAPSHNHNRQNSIDVRLHLNGKEHKSISVDMSRHVLTSPSKNFSDHPVKVKLPGREVTLVCPEEVRRPYAKYVKHRSQATSVSSQASCQSKGSYGMRSRQSSHTTVGTSGALENKLQSMILSHAAESPAMTTSTSMISQPSVSARSSSPLAVKASSMSAPPETSAVEHPALQPISPEQYYHQARGKHEHAVQADHIPPVPTAFGSRSSQLQAPPSLGPPQPQNLPEQIPNPYQYAAMNYSHGAPNYANHYASPSAYYNYYPLMPPQNFNSYNNFPMGLQMPIYDQPVNGTVYYNTDGTPIYPQEYYSGPYMMPDMYQHQFQS